MTRSSYHNYPHGPGLGRLGEGGEGESRMNVTITLPDDLAQWLWVQAAANDRSVSGWVADLLAGMHRREDENETAMKGY